MLNHVHAPVTNGPSDLSVRLHELETKGFVVVRSFLSDAEIQAFVDDYEDAGKRLSSSQAPRDAAARKQDAIDVPYKIRHVTPAARAVIQPKLDAMLAAVERDTTTRANLHTAGVFGSIYFATEGDLGLSWHQDHVSYYAYQDHHDYLNFYVPIVKPRRDKSNLCVIPFDALAARSPEVCARLRRRGASRIVIKKGKTYLYDHDRGGKHGVLPYDLNELAVTPELDRGDLLLLRGDVVHRTQDTDTKRLAVSIRLMNASTEVSRDALLRGGLVKTVLMTQGRGEFKRLLNCFDLAGRDALTVGEITEVQVREGLVPEPLSKARFLRYLLLNRLAARLRALA